jgi:hypothetical protein
MLLLLLLLLVVVLLLMLMLELLLLPLLLHMLLLVVVLLLLLLLLLLARQLVGRVEAIHGDGIWQNGVSSRLTGEVMAKYARAADYVFAKLGRRAASLGTRSFRLPRSLFDRC